MPVTFAEILPIMPRGDGAFSLKALDLKRFGAGASPLVVLDDFRVDSQPFPPHPHAGFSAVTYVFEDSPGALRSRDSLGHDVVVGPGGLVWTQAGSGIIHQEVPASAAELHGLQLFVKLGPPPRTRPAAHDAYPPVRGSGLAGRRRGAGARRRR